MSIHSYFYFTYAGLIKSSLFCENVQNKKWPTLIINKTYSGCIELKTVKVKRQFQLNLDL